MMKRLFRDALSVLCLTVAGSATMGQVWENLTPASGPVPAPRTWSSAIYDPLDNRMIVFGGRGPSSVLNDVWAFDLLSHSWTDITPVSNLPPARLTPNTVYDPVEHEMLLWAGEGASGFLNDVWAFDLETETWTKFTPPEPMPNLRYGTASVFDPLTRELVTFAGFTFAGRFDDTWRFNPDGDIWTDVSPVTGPHERCLHSSSYDVRGHRMIMYGGQRSGALDDIWALDLYTDTWTELTPTVRPTGRYFTAQAYDSARHRSLIFGGGPGSLDDVLSFDLATNSWSEILPTGTGPAGRDGATGIYVPTQDRLIVFGGGLRNDVWAVRFSEPGGVVFPGHIVGDGASFRWTVPVNVEFIRGDLAEVANLAIDQSGSLIHAASFPAAEDPAPGRGYYYMARVQGADGSWQSAYGDEPQRDLVLP